MTLTTNRERAPLHRQDVEARPAVPALQQKGPWPVDEPAANRSPGSDRSPRQTDGRPESTAPTDAALVDGEASTNNRDVWVVVPTYNEAPVVAGVIKDLRRFFPNVVGVDDGSADDSGTQLAAGGAWVVRHAVNLGAGAALQTGVQFALLDPGLRYLVTFDADGQHRTEDAVAMIERLRREDLDVLVGSRFLGHSEAMPLTRRLLLKAARTFEWTTSGVRLTDAHNGLRAFTRRFAERIDLRLSDMAHASELLGLIGSSGLPYAEQPVTVVYSDYSLGKGQRSINSVNIAMDVWVHMVLRGRGRRR